MASIVYVSLLWLCVTASAEVACRGCRPVKLQVAPAIGLDFTMAYGTAAVQLHNGTIIDVVKIDGSESYRAVMKQLAEDVQNEQLGQTARIPRLHFEHASAATVYDPTYRGPDLDVVQKVIKAAMMPFSGFLGAPGSIDEDPLEPPDEWTKPLHEMTAALTSKVLKDFPMAEKYAIFSGPDSLRVNHCLFPRLRHALRLAGFQEWGGFNTASSRVAATHLQFLSAQATQKFSDGNTAVRALIMTHTETALNLAIVQTSNGLLYDVRKTAAFVKPPVKHTKQQFAQNVRAALQEYLKGAKDGKEYLDLAYDEIILLGSGAHQEAFTDAIKAVFGDEINDPSGSTRIRNLTLDDSIYAAARGAAVIARRGLETAFSACIPNNWCAKPDSLVTADLPEETGLRVSQLPTHEEL